MVTSLKESGCGPVVWCERAQLLLHKNAICEGRRLVPLC